MREARTVFNPGDKVLVYSAPWDKKPTIGMVLRTTKTQAVLTSGSRYNIRDGSAVPYSAGGGHIGLATTEQLAAIERADRIRRLRSAIGEYISKAGPGEIEWLYGVLSERGMLP
jgi:hypothetical protein